jgi:6-phospho-beta-glucosidase
MNPLGLKYALHDMYSRYNVPLFIIENGLSADDTLTNDYKVHDDYCIEYFKGHIQAMKEAIDKGVDVFGYTTWAALI